VNKKILIALICTLIFIFISTILFKSFDNFESNRNDIKENNLIIQNKDDEIEKLKIEKEQLKEDILQLKNTFETETFLKNKQGIVDNYYSWIKDFKWNKVTLSNRSGTILDITDNEIFKIYLPRSYNEFKYQYMTDSPITKSYTYTFYFDNEIKEITLSCEGIIKIPEKCKNMQLYYIAESFLPIEDSLKKVTYNTKQLLLDSKIYTNETNPDDISYFSDLHAKYIILDWIPKNMFEIKKLPTDIESPIYEFVAYYRGENAYFKLFKYNDVLGYFIELSYKNESILYEMNNINLESDLKQLLQMHVK